MATAQILTVMGWVLAPICSSLITALVAVIKMGKVKESAKAEASAARNEALEKGVRALLRQQLIDYHREYVACGKPCPVRIKEQATAVYEAYKSLGGNGTGKQLWHEIMEAHVD